MPKNVLIFATEKNRFFVVNHHETNYKTVLLPMTSCSMHLKDTVYILLSFSLFSFLSFFLFHEEHKRLRFMLYTMYLSFVKQTERKKKFLRKFISGYVLNMHS